MAKVYGYGRHSTDKQGLTEGAQRETVETYIRQHLAGVEYGGWLYDSAVSGAEPLFSREQGGRLGTLLEPGDHVVWAKLDRAFRSVVDGAATLAGLGKRGIFVHSLDLGLDTSTAVGRCICTVMLAFAELEREYASARTRDALRQKRAAGLPYGRHTPIGYRRVGRGRTGKFVPDPDERAQVAEICRLRTAGLSYEAIVWRVAKLHRPNGHHWNRNSVRMAVRAAAAGYGLATASPAG
jgi:putative DNA-invertase from lambdoid prophage Rac